MDGRGWDGVGGRGGETGCSAWMRAKMYFLFFSFFSISSLRASRGRLDYQSGAASGTFFSVEHVGRKPGRKGSTSSSLLWCTYR